MSNKLSHSSLSRWQQCPTSYKYHYIDKIRPTKQHAALCFGTAIDRAIGKILNPKEDERSPKAIFDYFWRFQDIAGKQQYLPTLVNFVYSKNDFDKDLITDDDLTKLEMSREEMLALVNKRTELGFDNLSNLEKSKANHTFWLCLQHKGHYMIDAFEKKVMPKLKKVYAVQKYISLENDDSDSVIGYVDLIADVEGYNEPIILDIKTSSIQYDEEKSVVFSPQLTLYLHALSDEYKTRKAGFIVLNKNIIKNKTKICSVCGYDGSGARHKTCSNEIENKRCGGEWKETIDPDVYTQFIIDEIPEQTENLILSNIDEINQAMKNKVYTKNIANCLNSFGRPCDYINLCYRGEMQNLTKLE